MNAFIAVRLELENDLRRALPLQRDAWVLKKIIAQLEVLTEDCFDSIAQATELVVPEHV
jgi:hypothetical protein